MSNDDANRRIHYRVTPTFERAVCVELIRDGGQPVRVGVVDISSGGAGVAVPEGTLPTLKNHELIKLRFSSERFADPFEIIAEVRHAMHGTMAIRYGLRFENWEEHREVLGPKLRTLFNEREAFRVEPEAGERLSVEVFPVQGGVAMGGIIRDISVLGLGVWMRERDVALLESGQHIEARFTLPVSPDPLTCTCEVRHIQRESSLARRMVGLLIVPQRGAAESQLRRVLTDYVMNRQMSARRRGASKE
jgi:c-di-GMP-binding flagellar brake protein YcgR